MRAGRAKNLMYFSFVTLSTVGYGNIAAKSVVAQTTAILEGVTGQLFIAIFVSKLVAVHSIQASEEEKSPKKRR